MEKLFDSLADRELDRSSARKVEQHLKVCSDCSQKFDSRAALSSIIKKQATYHSAPAALADRIRAQFEGWRPAYRENRAGRFKMFDWARWLQLAGAVAATVVLTTTVTLRLAGTTGDPRVAEQIISGHSRSVLTNHQIDVASSDQHTVKPWLSARLDFSPTVVDLAESGFPLRGGRLDYVANRPVAVLVYGHRQHVIDLFIWPIEEGVRTSANRKFSQNGLNVLHWTAGGMGYWAVSDVNSADLEVFAERYATAS
jgi:anti-sigma factor RsiW